MEFVIKIHENCFVNNNDNNFCSKQSLFMSAKKTFHNMAQTLLKDNEKKPEKTNKTKENKRKTITIERYV